MSPLNNAIKVSVIIPCYNDGKYIQEAIDSVNAQTFKNFEIIVVDDGSTDSETQTILSKIKQDNLQVLFLKQNQGLPIARNRGIELAKGQYILPLDADDKIAPTYIEKACKVLDEDKDIGIVYCEAELFGETNCKWELAEFSLSQILIGNMIFATAMYRKTHWEKVNGYNKNMIHGYEDYDFWLSLLELDIKVYCIPEILFFYRQKKTSMVKKLEKDEEIKLAIWLQLFKNHKKLYTENIEIIYTWMRKQEKQIQTKDQKIQEKNKLLQKKDQEIQHLHNIIQSMRIRNRVKSIIRYFFFKT